MVPIVSLQQIIPIRIVECPGRTLNNLGRFTEAETAYRTAKYLLPRAKPGEKLVTRNQTASNKF